MECCENVTNERREYEIEKNISNILKYEIYVSGIFLQYF